jgi:hypothetical protein
VVKHLARGLLRFDDRATEQQMRDWAEGWRPYRGLGLTCAGAELRRRRLGK